MRELEQGTLIDDRYRVVSRIGSGGMADVYLAEDSQLGRQVAVKLLHQRFAQDQEFVERFRREASSAASLSHPNVVGVFDRGEWDGTYYIAMEYLAGRSLKALVRERGPLPPLEAIDLIEQVLRAARFAHQRGVVHRDLKPHNAIVDEEGRVKVTDFGIARAGASEITQTGSIMGTAQYLSPEQAQGHAVSARSDLYSIGILLYELLTGRIPFEGDSAVTIALKQISEPPTPPRNFNPAVPAELDAVVLRAMAKDPAERFADADEFLAALEHVRGRLAAGAGTTAEFAAVPVEPVLVEEQAYVLEPDPAGVPAEHPWRSTVWPWVLGGVLLAAAVALALALLLNPSERRVPNVVGQMQPEATATLQAAGFSPVVAPVTAATRAGLVLSQAPRAGHTAAKGSSVRITVSSGPGSAPVPDVTGRGRRLARRTLVKAGFRVSETRQTSDTVPVGRVISMTPQPLSQLQLGSTVSLTVSTGPQRQMVPTVTGNPESQATTILQAVGFRVAASERESNQPPGTVLSQTPPGASLAPRGSVVTLVVAKAPAAVTVPNVVGNSGVDASAALARAGLTPRQRSQTVTDPRQDGIVLSQTPAAATKVKKGAKVTIVVGRLANQNTTTTPTTTTPAPGK